MIEYDGCSAVELSYRQAKELYYQLLQIKQIIPAYAVQAVGVDQLVKRLSKNIEFADHYLAESAPEWVMLFYCRDDQIECCLVNQRSIVNGKVVL